MFIFIVSMLYLGKQKALNLIMSYDISKENWAFGMNRNTYNS